MVLEASRQSSCRFRGARAADYLAYMIPGPAWQYVRLMVTNARLLTSEGESNQALDNYLVQLRMANHLRNHGTDSDHNVADLMDRMVYDHLPYWATAPGQTPEIIRDSLQELEQIDRDRPSFESAIKADYALSRSMIEGDPDAFAGRLSTSEVRTITFLNYLAIWEASRASRLLNSLTHCNMRYLAAIQSSLEHGKPFATIS